MSGSLLLISPLPQILAWGTGDSSGGRFHYALGLNIADRLY
jgi:hypothetical protein